jgi:hypothetical protein
MSTSHKARKAHYSALTAIDTGMFDGCCWATNRSGSRRFVFVPTAEGRAHPVFAITDAEFNVIRWTGPKAAEAEAHYTALSA